MVDIFPKRIRKVPPLLRSHSSNKGKFDPLVVSIGPYHHGKMELQPAEAIKPLVVQLFLDDPHCLRGGEDNIRQLVPNSLRKDINSSIKYDDIRQLVKESVRYARSCYDKGSTESYSDDEFTEMMVLDGFFVLAFLQSYPSDQIGFYNLVASALGRHAQSCLNDDVIVLVENQIPFLILELLINTIFQDPNKGTEILSKIFSSFLSWNIAVPKGGGVNYAIQVKGSDILARSPIHLMEASWWCQYELDHQQMQKENPGRKTNFEDDLYYFSSVSELKDMGITVAPSTSTSPSAVTFKSGFLSGRLQLPPIIVSDGNDRASPNMMAYEFCSPHLYDLPATAYITFLKSLLNTPEDVRELRSKKVLFATGVSNERVLEIVKETVTFGIDDYRVYDHVKQRILDHCNRKWKTWMAELINKNQEFSVRLNLDKVNMNLIDRNKAKN